jgi:hypothetical protein
VESQIERKEETILDSSGICAVSKNQKFMQRFGTAELEKMQLEIEKPVQNAPNVQITAKGVYNLSYIEKFLQLVKRTYKAQHVRLEMGAKDEPLKITPLDKEGYELSFWIAPYMED